MVYYFEAHNRLCEWDPDKARSNLEKHGIDFVSVSEFEWDTAVIRSSDRRDKTRYAAYGFLGDRMHVVAFTMRRGRTRIISIRRASRTEVRDYGQDEAQGYTTDP